MFAVQELRRRDFHAGQRFWSQHVASLRAGMLMAGIPPVDADATLQRYGAAVGRALHPHKPILTPRQIG
jgi:hypothetical protein